MRISPLTSISLQEAVDVWNRGYEGYYSSVRFSVDEFASRFGRSGLSAEHSFVAYEGSLGVGIIVSGIAEILGRKVAWDGGTAVIPSMRGRGVGRALMEAALSDYRQAGVEIATLEAYKVNDPAIRLYERVGYRIVDELVFLKHTEALNDALPDAASDDVSVQCGSPDRVRFLPFYQADAPWGCQYMNVFPGESAISYDRDGNPTGYALFRKAYDNAGDLKTILLYQCVSKPGVDHPEQIVRALLHAAWSPLQTACIRMTFNFSSENKLVIKVLEEAGFTPATTNEGIPLTQVYMVNSL